MTSSVARKTTFLSSKKSGSFSDKDEEVSTSASGSERFSSESDDCRLRQETHRQAPKVQRKPKKRASLDLIGSTPRPNGASGRRVCIPPPGLTPPPGLELNAELAQVLKFSPPPGLLLNEVTSLGARGQRVVPPPGLESLHSMDCNPYGDSSTPGSGTPPSPKEHVYTAVGFRKELVSIMRDLAPPKSANSSSAVRRVRAYGVPLAQQASVFSDILSRTVEEVNGPTRRQCVVFAVGLATGECSAFDKDICLAGVATFFREVYADLCDEVPKLPSIVEREMLPTLQTVFGSEELNAFLPAGLRLVADQKV